MSKVVVLADGKFPKHKIPLSKLNEAEKIICCDGSADSLIKYGLEPYAIIGDMDSISEPTKIKYCDRIFQNRGQDTNDLTKAIEWCIANKIDEVEILGATGQREDHTIGNISLLADYVLKIRTCIITDYGIFSCIRVSTTFESFKGQQVSIFALDKTTKLTTKNLKYPLTRESLDSLWMGTLNESLGTYFSVNFKKGRIIICQAFEN